MTSGKKYEYKYYNTPRTPNKNTTEESPNIRYIANNEATTPNKSDRPTNKEQRNTKDNTVTSNIRKREWLIFNERKEALHAIDHIVFDQLLIILFNI